MLQHITLPISLPLNVVLRLVIAPALLPQVLPFNVTLRLKSVNLQSTSASQVRDFHNHTLCAHLPIMAADDSDSSLSSAGEEEMQKLAPIFVNAKKATKQRFPPPAVSPPRPKRPPSPPHEEVFADNPDIAVSVAHLEEAIWRVHDALYAPKSRLSLT